MQCLEVSGAVRHIYMTLGGKGLSSDQQTHTLTGFLFIYLFNSLFTYLLPNYLIICSFIYLYIFIIIYLFNNLFI
jgi:hypothetical protein